MVCSQAIRAGAVVALLLSAACSSAPETKSKWPPDDFELDVQYSVVTGDRQQIRKSAKIFADGLVVYREADTSLRTTHGDLELPVFQRICAYRMHWRSIRDLSRMLHREGVQELDKLGHPPPSGEEAHVIRFRLTYHVNHVNALAQDEVVGLMNRVLRLVNSFLPADGLTLPRMAGKPDEHHLQDVPPIEDSIPGALAFHKKWLSDEPKNTVVLRDTFSLACSAEEWDLAEECITRLSASRPADVEWLRQILRGARGSAGGR